MGGGETVQSASFFYLAATREMLSKRINEIRPWALPNRQRTDQVIFIF